MTTRFPRLSSNLEVPSSFPGRFGDQGQAKTFCRSFFRWYNAEHRHGGISMLTPEQVHFGNADQVIAGRKSVLREAWPLIPNASSEVVPKPKPLPEAVFINPPIPSLHHTGHCSLINPVECPIVVDRFRFLVYSSSTLRLPETYWIPRLHCRSCRRGGLRAIATPTKEVSWPELYGF